MTAIAPIVRRAKQVAGWERRQLARRGPIDDRTVLYESFAGNGMLCNPEAIFRALLAAGEYRDLHHVWALTDPELYAGTADEFHDDPRVSFVKRGSPRYYRALATAKYLINNATFPEPFAKRDGQVYLNTWHGTPLKAMGYDVPGGALATHNVVRNLVAADWLLAPNDDTERMYLDAYRMTNVFHGRLIAEGTPRIDRQFVDREEQARIRSRLATHGVGLPDGHRLLLYAPTWKGDFYRPDDDVAELRDVVVAVTEQLGRPDHHVLLKVHQRTYDQARKDPALRHLLVPNAIPTNDLLALTDVLITDYSSTFIDFLASGRPVLFYAPDLDEYTATRGVYVPPDQWPGPISRDVAGLVADIRRLDRDAPPPDAYTRARARYCPREDGQATRRIVDIVFGAGPGDYDVRGGLTDGRRPILLQLGGLQPNGITSSALSLLRTIDHDRYDVSVSFPQPGRAEEGSVAMLDPRVRLFPQPAQVTGSKIRVRALARFNGRSGRRRQLLAKGYPRLMRQEWTRSFGAARFERVVDFSGYEPYWIKLLAARTSGEFAIWLHNEIAAEMTNPDRPPRLRSRISAAVALYRSADHLVSVSERLAELNRTQLAEWAPPDRFTHARNTIDAERVHRLAADPEAAAAVPPAPGVRTFVTAGRLSPAKNHLRLIEAFRAVHEQDAATRLVILGDGPLMPELQAAVADHRLAAAVLLPGYRANPYPVMARADCFVLSSDYEGQPMVLLEALVLGRPIISTAFDTVRDALPAGHGLVVQRDTAALAEGMRAFLRGDVPATSFDAEAYNAECIREFYRAIGAE